MTRAGAPACRADTLHRLFRSGADKSGMCSRESCCSPCRERDRCGLPDRPTTQEVRLHCPTKRNRRELLDPMFQLTPSWSAVVFSEVGVLCLHSSVAENRGTCLGRQARSDGLMLARQSLNLLKLSLHALSSSPWHCSICSSSVSLPCSASLIWDDVGANAVQASFKASEVEGRRVRSRSRARWIHSLNL